MITGGRSYLSWENFDESLLSNIATVDRIVCDGGELTAKTIRELLAQANQSPLGEMRLLLIRNAGEMSEIIQNTLLKILEEPPKQLAILLLTNNDSRLLPTVRSRLEKLTTTATKTAKSSVNIEVGELLAVKDRAALVEKLATFRDSLHQQVIDSGSNVAADRLILVDRALTRLAANCSQKLVLDSLLLHFDALSDIELDNDH